MKWAFATLALSLTLASCAKHGDAATTSSPTVSIAQQPFRTYTPTQKEIESDPDSVVSKKYTEQGCNDAFGYTIGYLEGAAERFLVRQEYSKARHLAKASLKGMDLCGVSSATGPHSAEGHIAYATALYIVAKSYVEQGDEEDGAMQAGAASAEADAVARNPDNSASDRMAARQLLVKINNLAPN